MAPVPPMVPARFKAYKLLKNSPSKPLKAESWFASLDHVVGASIVVSFAILLYELMCLASCHIHPTQLNEVWLDIAVLTFGILCGWAGGTFISPSVAKESERFTKLGTAVGTFLTGYVLSKLDKITARMGEMSYWDVTHSFRLLMWLTGLLLAALVTYVLRAYLLPSSEGLQG